MAIKRNKKIAKANEDNKKLSATKEMQELYWMEQKALYAENTRLAVATEKGKKEERLEIAKKLLKMKIPIEQIAEATGLSKNEIEKIQ